MYEERCTRMEVQGTRYGWKVFPFPDAKVEVLSGVKIRNNTHSY